ncbi:MAG: Maff2 family mobile element protein [Coprococcus phoceensis]
MTRTAPAGRTLRFITALSARLTCPKPNARPIRHSPKCRIGTAKFFTLLLLLYRTLAKSQGIKQLMSGGGIIIVAQTVIPQLTTLFS